MALKLDRHVLAARLVRRVNHLDVLVARGRSHLQLLAEVDRNVLFGVPSVYIRLKLHTSRRRMEAGECGKPRSGALMASGGRGVVRELSSPARKWCGCCRWAYIKSTVPEVGLDALTEALSVGARAAGATRRIDVVGTGVGAHEKRNQEQRQPHVRVASSATVRCQTTGTLTS